VSIGEPTKHWLQKPRCGVGLRARQTPSQRFRFLSCLERKTASCKAVGVPKAGVILALMRLTFLSVIFRALIAWSEKGQAPADITASQIVNGAVTRPRPLCPYPQVAKYKGAGSTDEAANFVCSP
jgi:hypothetical protein